MITLVYSLRAIARGYPLYCLILKTPLSVFKQTPFKEGFSKQTHN
ncbi:hypothetical protein N203_00555 [Helicobacter pylori UM084]|nr:hypothetical protein N203_00555 [Helicobacter pylori UM084]